MQGQRGESSGGQNTRLPTIAPRYEGEKSEGVQALDPVTSELTTNRLPPRSRRGCWTCRTRKVKCDEQRPSCGQCTRLGHTCDYNPRLVFKDDTPRILERLQNINTVGNTIWDPDVNPYSRPAEVEDTLPPFSTLTTDEERERKAETRGPGQYFVLANLGSFASLPEYRDESLADLEKVVSFESADYDTDSGSRVLDSGDPDVVILKNFEDPVRSAHGSAPQQLTTRRASQPMASQHPQAPSNQLSMLDIAQNGGKDAELLQHYRTVISPKIRRTTIAGGEDLIEIQARTYPPLYHAIMALSALSMAHNVQRPDALEHYQQVIPALKNSVQSSEDSYSDGAFLSHYILLLYEVAAVGNRESNMWQAHCNALLRIIILRRQTGITEHHSWIIFSIYLMDIYALLSTTGTGSFSEILLQQNMIPEPEQISTPIQLGFPQSFYNEEESQFPELIRLNQEMLVLALQIGKMAQELRAEAARMTLVGGDQDVPDAMYQMNRRTRIRELHRVIENSRTEWRSRYPAYRSWLSRADTVSTRVSRAVEHFFMLFPACVIYAYTSMYPGQLQDTAPDSDLQVSTCATEIINVASARLSQQSFELRYLVFPLFMAGIFTQDRNEKAIALNLIIAVEPHSLGRSIESVRVLLQMVYDKQREALLRFGDARGVDWVEEMEVGGLSLIMMGL